MTAFEDVHPHVHPHVQPQPKPRKGHRDAESVKSGHPLMSNTGQHVQARRSPWPLLVGMLLPIVGALLVLYALSLFGQPSSAEVVPPVLQVAVSPSACTFPDGS